MPNSKVIVTIATGRFTALWKNHCETSWRAYADKHGYDIVCFTEPLDQTPRAKSRSASWQKCLILSQPSVRNYERVVWLDADIIINASESPSIADGVPADKIGAVAAFSTPSRELYLLAFRRAVDYWRSRGASVTAETTPADYYANFGLPTHHGEVLQGGVLVLSPSHQTLLEKVYFNYEDRGGPEWHYEMRPLSFELLESGLVQWLDWRFNVIWMLHMALHYPFLLNAPRKLRRYWRGRNHVRRFFDLVDYQRLYQSAVTTTYLNSYFLHFASTPQDLPRVNRQADYWDNAQLI